jgi:hypothetical protein
MFEDGTRRPTQIARSKLPPRQVLTTACSLVTDTSNGVSAVKVGDVVLDPELERAIEVIDDHPGTRLVLRRARDGGVALVVEQALEPIHHLPREQPSWLERLWPWRHAGHDSPMTPDPITREARRLQEAEDLR